MSWVWCVWGHHWASRHGMTQRLSHGPSTSNLHLHKDKGWISELFIHVRPCMQTWGLGHFTPGGNWTINSMWNSVSLLWCLDSTGCLWSLGREEGRGRTEFGSKKCQDRGETSVEAKPSLSCGWGWQHKRCWWGPSCALSDRGQVLYRAPPWIMDAPTFCVFSFPKFCWWSPLSASKKTPWDTKQTPNTICIVDLSCWLTSHWGLWLFSLAHPDDWLGQVSSSQSGHILCLQLPLLCDFRQVLWCLSVTYLPSPITSRVHGLLLSLMDWRLSMEAPRRRISHRSSFVIPGCSHFFILPIFFTLSHLTLPWKQHNHICSQDQRISC